MVRLYSWNVNGIRAVSKKIIKNELSFVEWILHETPDVLCIQETKAHKNQLDDKITKIKSYKAYFAEAERKGYSGVVTYVHKSMGKHKNKIGLGISKFDKEGRTVITEFDDFILFNFYVPNGKMNEDRLAYKMEFYYELTKQMKTLQNEDKKIIITGDINTAHQEIDLARPKPNEKISGFLPKERKWITSFLKQGFIDSFRYLHPDEIKYSWWSMRAGARNRNVGWRLDYFYLSNNLIPNLKKSEIHNDIMGSDHCPVSVVLDF
ncbi:MAG: exodeoxyribonuclease III [Candidatus Hodarchaeales archaeon]|jgi:exodeoxyribonuclease-3